MGRRVFGYWHVIPAVRHEQVVRQHQLLGRVEGALGHLHFAESTRLRKGALTPWVDPSSPRIAGIAFSRGGRAVSPLEVSGSVDVIVDA